METVTGLSLQQEQEYQQRTLVRVSRLIDNSLAREIKRAMIEIASLEGNTGKQAESKAKHTARVDKILQKHYNRVYEAFGMRLLNSAASKAVNVDQVPPTDRFNAAQIAWVREQAAYKASLISGTTEKQTRQIITQAVEQGIAEGLGERETSRLMIKLARQKGGSLSKSRSRVISRTESHAASTASTQTAADASGLPMKKRWVTAGSRARPAHARANGQTINLNSKFNVGGEDLRYPGDTGGSPENVINFRS